MHYFRRISREFDVALYVSILLLKYELIKRLSDTATWEFPKIRGTLFWSPYNKNPTI